MDFNEKRIEFSLCEQVFTDMFKDEEDDLENYFVKDRIIRLVLDCGKGFDSKSLLSYFDKLLIQAAVDQRDNIQRWVRCTECKQKGKKGYFLAEENFKVTEKERCREREEHDFLEKEDQGN